MRSTRWRLALALPAGKGLAPTEWRRRHRGIVGALWLQLVLLLGETLIAGDGLAHGLAEATPVALLAWLASHSRRPGVAAAAATLGLLTATAIWVHVSGGLIEMHFLFFIALNVITLYRSWTPFLLAVGFVVAHHGIAGSLFPEAIYNHAAAIDHPWRWALIHGGFVAAGCVASLVAWKQTEEQATHDFLTGLPNRAGFLQKVTGRLAQKSEPAPPAVAVVDLDRFQAVNDSLGYDVGDVVLREVGRRLGSVAGPGSTVARLAADEFGVLFEAADGPAAQAMGERIIAAVGAPLVIDGHTVLPLGSAGLVRAVGCDAETVLRKADLALYDAKRMGPGQYRLYNAKTAAVSHQRLGLGSDLRGAAERGELSLRYQPVVDLATGDLLGFEALLRWLHPTLGFVGPDQFIPVAEETGLIRPIGRWVLDAASRQAAVWQERYPQRNFTMAVNVSGRQLDDSGFVEQVADALDRSGCDPSRLVLEFTETAIIDDSDLFDARLGALKDLGLRLALDDFGTGHSSLSCLRRLPIDIIKIDKSFIDDVDHQVDTARLAEVILSLARLRGLDTVVEGVERDEQRRALLGLGCDAAQGYLFAEPLAADEAEIVLQRGFVRIPASLSRLPG